MYEQDSIVERLERIPSDADKVRVVTVPVTSATSTPGGPMGGTGGSFTFEIAKADAPQVGDTLTISVAAAA